MHVTFTPEDGDKAEWVFQPNRVKASEQAIVEKQAGKRWDEFVNECKVANRAMRRVLLWHLIRREHPALKWESTPDFCDDEILIELDADEIRVFRDAIEKIPNLSDVEREIARQQADEQIEAAEAKFGDVGPGKAPSRNEPTDTAG